MTTVFARCMLFFSSYFPLSLIFCILLLGKHTDWAIGVLIAGVASLAFSVAFFLSSRRTLADSQGKITSFQKRDADVMGYIATYLIPFVTFPLDGLQQVAALFVFIVVLLVVYVNSHMIYINPLLNLAGFHLYEITIEHSALSHFYIARQRVLQGATIHFVRLSDDIFVEK